MCPGKEPRFDFASFNRSAREIDGLIKMANQGDVGAAKTLLKRFCYAVDMDREPRKELMNYISGCLKEAYQKGDANIALNFSRNTPGSHKAGYLKLQQEIDIAYRVAVLIDENIEKYGKKNKDGAYIQAGLEFNVNKETARKHYERYMKI